MNLATIVFMCFIAGIIGIVGGGYMENKRIVGQCEILSKFVVDNKVYSCKLNKVVQTNGETE